MEISPVRSWRKHAERRRLLGKRGVVVHYSVVHVAPEGLLGHDPYIVGLVEIESERVVAQIVDVEPSRVHSGMRVVGRLRRLFEVEHDAVVIYGVKFAPEEKNEAC